MRTIIHDLKENELKKIKFNDNDILISSLNCENSCVGCFFCWVKHPKKCAIKDMYSDLVKEIAKSDELILISKNRYGCYSNTVKRVLERCIGYVLPFFDIREGRIHHKSRYNNKLKFKAYFYGKISELDKKCLYDLVKANSINLNAKEFEIKFLDDKKGDFNCIL